MDFFSVVVRYFFIESLIVVRAGGFRILCETESIWELGEVTVWKLFICYSYQTVAG